MCGGLVLLEECGECACVTGPLFSRQMRGDVLHPVQSRGEEEEEEEEEHPTESSTAGNEEEIPAQHGSPAELRPPSRTGASLFISGTFQKGSGLYLHR